jgi:hypothetical protein
MQPLRDLIAVCFMVMKRFPAAGILLCLVATCVVGRLAAQPRPEASRARLLSPSEGESIVLAAWELRRGLPSKPDCSHFVHAIYTKAGFNYEYAQSSDLFEGIESFQRVSIPQAGDLVAWQGHVGIVVDPAEHSFYSSVVTGFAIENYRSNYWIGRGAPRFYRYLVTSEDARIMPPAVRAAPITSASKPQADADPAAALAPSAPKPRRGGSQVTPPEFRSRYLETRESDTETRDVVFASSRAKPAKDEVLAAIIGAVDGRAAGVAESLRLGSAPQVVVADSFNVVGLHIKNNSGWVELEVQQKAVFRFGSADPTPLTNRWRVALSRQDQVWVLLVPRGLIFLRNDLAKTVLRRHLSTLPRANKREREKVQQILAELASKNDTAELGSNLR